MDREGPQSTDSGAARLDGRGTLTTNPLRIFVRGSLLRSLSTGATLLLALPATAALVRTMGLRGYGSLQFATAIAFLVGPLSNLGLGTGISRLCAHDSTNAARWAALGFRLSLLSGTLGSFVCAAIALSLP